MRSIEKKVVGCGVDLLITSGNMAESIAAGAVEAGMDKRAVKSFGNEDGDFGEMAGLLRSGDVILLKGSRAMRVERLTAALEGNIA